MAITFTHAYLLRIILQIVVYKVLATTAITVIFDITFRETFQSARTVMAKGERRDPKHDALRRRGTLHARANEVSDPLFVDNDFFDPRDLIQVKYEMLRRVRVDGQPILHVARAFGFSRPSFYDAQAAFAEAGLPGLLPEKRGPRGAHKLSARVVAFLQQELARDAKLTPAELCRRLLERFGLSVHPRSIERVLSRSQKKLDSPSPTRT
jgi:transposase